MLCTCWRTKKFLCLKRYYFYIDPNWFNGHVWKNTLKPHVWQFLPSCMTQTTNAPNSRKPMSYVSSALKLLFRHFISPLPYSFLDIKWSLKFKHKISENSIDTNVLNIWYGLKIQKFGVGNNPLGVILCLMRSVMV